ncbi:PAQR family membrane homeostasis protein TrhA [Rhodohalobacter barkolensis]|jgi:hemolysin III|uniref:Hemolysin III n=1 Tax=Rhodohalobacter barkolensis TaxID=2053187 RepID=A0A2N0VK47_9BACT|nr:hemolysin III family protein [Rhodohalobacter barkolensis]PKD44567.1 hemolysin III [Rhodohalobacter barkolensis]
MYKGERFNSITHLIGAIAAIAGLFALIYIAVKQGDPWKIASFTIYGSTLFILYLFSTLYHSFKGKWKKIFQKFDHIAIYLLIAGTYTPFTLVTLPDSLGWTFFAIIWGLAMIGIVIDLLPQKGHRILPLVIYLLMGWLVVLVLEPLTQNLPMTGFELLITGGVFYTMGVLFYVLDSKHKLAHGIWHLFVLAGSVSHFISVAAFV